MDSLKPLKLEKWETQGIKIHWSDGHATGIFAFEYLRSICECDECRLKAT